MADPVTAAVVGGTQLIAGRQANKAASQAQSAADRNAQLAYEQSLPWDVTGAFGSATFDPETRAATVALGPEYQQIIKDRLARSGMFSKAIEAYDPQKYQEQYLQKLEAIAKPKETLAEANLLNQLRRTGLLNASPGTAMARGFYEAQGQTDLTRQLQSIQAARDEMNYLRGLESTDLATALDIGNLGMDYLTAGRGIGTGLTSAAQAGASMRNTAAQNVADTKAAFWGGLASSVGQYGMGGGFTSAGYQNPYAYRGAMPLGGFGMPINSGTYGYNPY